METIELMHAKRRSRRGNKAGLRKARCVRACKAGKGRHKHAKHTLSNCRRRCGVKAK